MMRKAAGSIAVILMLGAGQLNQDARGSEAAPLPGLPGSAVPPSATPGTSISPASVPAPPMAPHLLSPRPTGSPAVTMPAGPPAFSRGLLEMQDQPSSHQHVVGKLLRGKRKSDTPAPPPGRTQMRPTLIESGSAHGADQDNSIEAFFQIPPSSPSASVRPTGKRTNQPLQAPLSQAAQGANQSDRSFHVGRALYHVLDNIGVPLPYNKNEALDPSLKMAPSELSVAAEKLPSAATTVTSESQTHKQTDPKQSAQSTAAKIPESELEGVELPAPRDVPKNTP